MKAHFLSILVMILIASACASNEGRSISSTQETPQERAFDRAANGMASRDQSGH